MFIQVFKKLRGLGGGREASLEYIYWHCDKLSTSEKKVSYLVQQQQQKTGESVTLSQFSLLLIKTIWHKKFGPFLVREKNLLSFITTAQDMTAALLFVNLTWMFHYTLTCCCWRGWRGMSRAGWAPPCPHPLEQPTQLSGWRGKKSKTV